VRVHKDSKKGQKLEKNTFVKGGTQGKKDLVRTLKEVERGGWTDRRLRGKMKKQRRMKIIEEKPGEQIRIGQPGWGHHQLIRVPSKPATAKCLLCRSRQKSQTEGEKSKKKRKPREG